MQRASRKSAHQTVDVAGSKPFIQRIVTAARQHFLSNGFRSVTMDDLAHELGMSKKTLYASFPSKTALLDAVLADKFRAVEADLEEITSTCASDVLGALHRLLACMQRHTEELRPPFVRDMRKEGPVRFKEIERRRRDLIERHFGKLLGEGRKAGIIRKDLSVPLIMEILLGAVQAIMNPVKIEELGLTPKTGFSTIITVILEGIVTEPVRAKL
ncbi:TetR/AcrR family transcriptional regulator [Nitrospira sp. KM1]|uniref:TetR/AcrR family transcriptional regulator n=1 Tax=Nitrospira sp. KM1 TaxID=1936990 RepID=UPI00156322CC|nr:TetR/AcrR family transcriptional regulator [Nitrospira sp. KM1]